MTHPPRKKTVDDPPRLGTPQKAGGGRRNALIPAGFMALARRAARALFTASFVHETGGHGNRLFLMVSISKTLSTAGGGGFPAYPASLRAGPP